MQRLKPLNGFIFGKTFGEKGDEKKFNALPKKDIENDSLHRWLTFFGQNISDDLLKELMDMDAAIDKANEKMTFKADNNGGLNDE